MTRNTFMAISAFTITIMSAGLICYNSLTDQTNGPAAERLLHVFEVVRHGARAPLLRADAFKVPAQMLTSQGMR